MVGCRRIGRCFWARIFTLLKLSCRIIRFTSLLMEYSSITRPILYLGMQRLYLRLILGCGFWNYSGGMEYYVDKTRQGGSDNHNPNQGSWYTNIFEISSGLHRPGIHPGPVQREYFGLEQFITQVEIWSYGTFSWKSLLSFQRHSKGSFAIVSIGILERNTITLKIGDLTLAANQTRRTRI